MSPTKTPAAVKGFGLIEGTTLKNYKLLRIIYLKEQVFVEEATCALCDLNREILYWGCYDRNRNVEAFYVCELCGKELIESSAAIIKSVEAAPSSGLAKAVAKIQAMRGFHRDGRGMWIPKDEVLAILKEQTGGSQG